MKSEYQIKRLAKKIRIKPDVAVDERVLACAETALAKSTKNQDVILLRRPSIWRTIMKSPITKLAAAAVIIVAVFIGIYLLGSPFVGATVTFAQVQKAMNEVSWLHMTFTGDDRDEHDISELWVGFEAEIYASTLLDNYARHVDLSKAIEHNYDPEANKIVATAVNEDEFEYDLGSPWATLQSMIGNLADEGAAVEYSTGNFEGQQVSTITLTCVHDDGCCTCKLFVDPDTHLIIGGRQTWEDKHDDQVIHTRIEVQYPETGPGSIYDLGVPRTAKVVDHADK